MPVQVHEGENEAQIDASEPLMQGDLQFIAGTIKDGEQERMKRINTKIEKIWLYSKIKLV